MSNASDFNSFGGCLFKYVGPGGEVVVPDGVTRMIPGAFQDCDSLTSITLPEGLTSIASNAFKNCSNLTSVTLPDGVTSIGDLAFDGCSSLTSIMLPDSLTCIGLLAFAGCESLRNIILPTGLTEIGVSAFHGCRGLADSNGFVIFRGILYNYYGDERNVVLPDVVKSIDSFAFSDCNSLESIVLPEGVTSIGMDAFQYCSSLTSVIIPESVASIGAGAFRCCSSLTSIQLPDGVTSIGDHAFYGCSSLTGITLPEGVTTLSDSVFGDCSSLTEITLPEGVTSIGETAFWNCSNLTDITLPESVESIGKRAFEKCLKLESITIKNKGLILDNNIFGKSSTVGPIGCKGNMWAHMTDECLKTFVLEKKTWAKLVDAMRVEIFLSRQGKTLEPAYKKCVTGNQLKTMGEAILARLDNEPSTKECSAAVKFITMFYSGLPEELLNRLYAVIKKAKGGSNTLKAVDAQPLLMERLGISATVDTSLSSAEWMDLDALIAEKSTTKELAQRLKEYYGLTYKDLPQLRTAEGTETSPDVLA